MRIPAAPPVLALVLSLALGTEAPAQTTPPACTGGATTSITGTVYAPNGTDPLPNVTVYIPTTTVEAFPPGVSCPLVGAPPSGTPLVGTITATDGTFELDDVPVGTNIPLVIVSGKWRRQLVIPSTTACNNTALPASFAAMPQNQTQGDIPKIAIATGAVDQVECVLRKVGIDNSEFTNPGGPGRINLYSGSGGPGAVIDSTTPNQSVLMGGDGSTLNSYDLLMLPCQGTPNKNVDAGTLGTQELANFINFANSGGRIYTSHYSYVWMNTNPPFNGVAEWDVGQGDPPNGVATVDTSFSAGATLSNWLQDVGASVSPGQMAIDTLRKDTDGVIPPTQSWLTLNDPAADNPVMQFVFDTPIAPPGSTINQCGRVLFNEYHVEGGTSSPSYSFPNECSTGPMTPQEKLLEYMLFELTDEGGQPSLAPLIQDFGSEAVTYTTAPVDFTWTNNSSFTSQVKSATATGDFSVLSSDCASVAGGASCTINVVFTPSALGARSGTLTVVSGGNSLTAALTGTGTPGYMISATSLTYGNLDVGASATQKITVTNIAPGPLPVPPFVTAGEYKVDTTPCGSSIPVLSHCQINVTFDPTTTGPQSGTLSVASTSLLDSGLTASLSGNGIDFALSLNPTSGSVVAGDSVSSTLTLTPIAGYDAAVTLSCNVAGAVASTCGVPSVSVPLSETVSQTITINTTSQYTVVGYSGWGGRGYLWLIALASGWMLWRRRRSASSLLRTGLFLAVLAAIGLSMSGCSGKLPAQNPAYTGPGSYVVTVTATDGFLVHTATYTLKVTQ